MSDMFLNGFSQALEFLVLGGPVVALLLVISVISLSIIILKYWQFWAAGVGRHAPLRMAVGEWAAGRREAAADRLRHSPNAASVLTWQAMMAVRSPEKTDRSVIEEKLAIEASSRLVRLRSGFRALDAIAQVAPLLGLFGTVLGMIEAFQQLQTAGNNVDPSLLAGGIWVALLTTAVGLGVAMPTSLALTHLESRMAREAAAIEYALTCVLNPLRLYEPHVRAFSPEGGTLGQPEGYPSHAA